MQMTSAQEPNENSTSEKEFKWVNMFGMCVSI